VPCGSGGAGGGSTNVHCGPCLSTSARQAFFPSIATFWQPGPTSVRANGVCGGLPRSPTRAAAFMSAPVLCSAIDLDHVVSANLQNCLGVDLAFAFPGLELELLPLHLEHLGGNDLTSPVKRGEREARLPSQFEVLFGFLLNILLRLDVDHVPLDRDRAVLLQLDTGFATLQEEPLPAPRQFLLQSPPGRRRRRLDQDVAASRFLV